MMSGTLLMVMAVCIFQVQSYGVKRGLDEKQHCFAAATAKLYSHYTGNDEGGQLIRAAFMECMEESGKEEECLLGKKAEFVEKFGEDHFNLVEEIWKGVAGIDFIFRGHCCGLEGDKLDACDAAVYTGILNSADCDEECKVFVNAISDELKSCRDEQRPPPTRKSFAELTNPLENLRVALKNLKKYKK